MGRRITQLRCLRRSRAVLQNQLHHVQHRAITVAKLMKSTALMNESWKSGKNQAKGCYGGDCMFYSAADITELVGYAAQRGVRFVPSTGLMPGVSAFIYNATII